MNTVRNLFFFVIAKGLSFSKKAGKALHTKALKALLLLLKKEQEHQVTEKVANNLLKGAHLLSKLAFKLLGIAVNLICKGFIFYGKLICGEKGLNVAAFTGGATLFLFGFAMINRMQGALYFSVVGILLIFVSFAVALEKKIK